MHTQTGSSLLSDDSLLIGLKNSTNPEAAHDFLVNLAPERNIYTFAIAPYSQGKKKYTTFKPIFCTRNTLLQTLHTFVSSNETADIFFTPNETTNFGRKKTDLSTLHTFYLDLDGASIDDITAKLEELSILPHAVVATSPSRYHVYIKISPLAASPTTLTLWQNTAFALSRLNTSTDYPGVDGPSSRDPARLLRVPFFISHKNRCLVTSTASSSHEAYELSSLESFFHQSPSLYNRTPDIDFSGDTIYSKGDRHNTLISAANHLLNFHAKEDAFELYATFVKECVDNSDSEYLQNNALTPEAVRLFNDAARFQETQRVQLLDSASTLDSQLDSQIEDETPFFRALPDEFFKRAPCNLYPMIKEIADLTLNKDMTMAFLALATAAGAFKSLSYLTPTSCPPTIYALAVAPTGTGKSVVAAQIKNLFIDANLTQHYIEQIRSPMGFIYTFAEYCKGVAMLYLDESFGVFKEILAKENSSLSGLHDFFLSMMRTKHYSPATTMQEVNRRGKVVPSIDYPALSIFGNITPVDFSRIATRENIQSGFFPRFVLHIAPTVPSKITSIPTYKDITSKSDLFASSAEFFGSDLTTRKASVKTLAYGPGTEEYFKSIQCKYTNKGSAADAAGSIHGDYYKRVAENMLRLASALTLSDTLDLETLQFAEEFLDHQVTAFLDYVDQIEGTNISKQDKQRSDVYDKIYKLIVKHCPYVPGRPAESTMPVRNIYKRAHLPALLVTETLQLMERHGVLKLEKVALGNREAKKIALLTKL